MSFRPSVGARIAGAGFRIQTTIMAIFDEQYRVIAVESKRLVIRGVSSGHVLVINADPEVPLTPEDYPLGKLIALTDPSIRPSN